MLLLERRHAWIAHRKRGAEKMYLVAYHHLKGGKSKAKK
jgi:hypothetical protein